MSLLPVRIYGDPVLRQEAEPVEKIDQEIKDLAQDMIETMYENDGVGLAGNQVGIAKRIFVMDSHTEQQSGARAFINPIIKNRKGSAEMEEGCLSIPDIRSDVKRSKEFDFEAIDLDGNKVEFHAEGVIARIIQHETDHLDGRLFIDYLSPVKRIMIKDQLKKLEKKSEEFSERTMQKAIS